MSQYEKLMHSGAMSLQEVNLRAKKLNQMGIMRMCYKKLISMSEYMLEYLEPSLIKLMRHLLCVT